VLRWPDVIPAGTLNPALISVLDLLPTLASAANVPLLSEKPLDGINRWDAVTGLGAAERGAPLYFTSNSPIYNRFMHGVLDGKWKLIQTIDHSRRNTKIESMLFDIVADPSEEHDLARQHPEQVKRLSNMLDKRLAQHPVGGVYVQLMPHPGWRAPLDYAEAVTPAEQINEDAYLGYGEGPSERLQQLYGDKGRILYE